MSESGNEQSEALGDRLHGMFGDVDCDSVALIKELRAP